MVSRLRLVRGRGQRRKGVEGPSLSPLLRKDGLNKKQNLFAEKREQQQNLALPVGKFRCGCERKDFFSLFYSHFIHCGHSYYFCELDILFSSIHRFTFSIIFTHFEDVISIHSFFIFKKETLNTCYIYVNFLTLQRGIEVNKLFSYIKRIVNIYFCSYYSVS